MWVDLAQRQRFEQKFILTEEQVRVAREIIRCYLKLDPFAQSSPDKRTYTVHSLYLDSPDLLTYWAWVCCEKRRFKLRLRYYNSESDSIVFLEVKQRENNCILKSRAPLLGKNVRLVINQALADPTYLVHQGPEQVHALRKFMRLMCGLHARPILHVWYSREAWMSPSGNSLRITFDRAIKAELVNGIEIKPVGSTSVAPYGDKVIMEVKFTDAYPAWVSDLVKQINAVSSGAAKYCRCVEALYGQTRLFQAPPNVQLRLEQLLRNA